MRPDFNASPTLTWSTELTVATFGLSASWLATELELSCPPVMLPSELELSLEEHCPPGWSASAGCVAGLGHVPDLFSSSLQNGSKVCCIWTI